MKYELTLILRPETTEEQADELISKYEGVIKELTGVFTSAEKWGKRPLMGRFSKDRHITDGVYVLIRFSQDEGNQQKLNYMLKIDDQIMRHMIVRDTDLIKPRSKKKKQEAKAG